MKKIKDYVERIKEELRDAQDYAEKYVENKVKGEIQIANQYKDMANDELKHAMYIHEWAVREISAMSKVYTPPVEMQEKWDREHKEYVEDVALIRQILSM